VLSQGNTINTGDLPPVVRQIDKYDSITQEDDNVSPSSLEQEESFSFKQIREKAEKEYLIDTLKKAEGNISKASKLAGVSRRHFYDKLQQYGIKPRKL
jgi:transcriptional regulator of acetoin/glycerol metabolism